MGGLPEQIRETGLPSEQQWRDGLARAEHLLGITLTDNTLTPANLAELAAQARARLHQLGPAATRLPPVLAPRLERWGLSKEPPRLQTAHSGAELVRKLPEDIGDAELIRRLAAFVPQTSVTALGRSLATAGDVVALLDDTATWLVLDQAAAQRHDPELAAQVGGLLAGLADVLETDEHERPLVATLEQLIRDAAEIISATPPPRMTEASKNAPQAPEPPRPAAPAPPQSLSPGPPPGSGAVEPVTSFSVTVRGPRDSTDIDFLVSQLARQIRSHLVCPVSGAGELILEAKVTLHRRHYR
jgi:hypothetical protein